MRFIFAVSMLLFLSCNSEKKNKVLKDPTPPILGTYQSCQNDSGASVKTIVLLGEKTFSGMITVYSGSNCQTGNEVFEEVDTYSYSFQSSTSINMTLKSVTFTSTDATFTASLNSDNFCGFNNWVTNTPKFVGNLTCDGITMSLNQTSGLAIYSSGTNLVISEDGETATYSLVKKLEHTGDGATPVNGNYGYYDGDIGVHVSISGSTIVTTYFDPVLLKYYSKNASFTVANEVATITWTGSTPAGCNPDGAPVLRNLIPSNVSIALESLETEPEYYLFHKMNYNATTYRNGFLTAGYTQGCF